MSDFYIEQGKPYRGTVELTDFNIESDYGFSNIMEVYNLENEKVLTFSTGPYTTKANSTSANVEGSGGLFPSVNNNKIPEISLEIFDTYQIPIGEYVWKYFLKDLNGNIAQTFTGRIVVSEMTPTNDYSEIEPQTNTAFLTKEKELELKRIEIRLLSCSGCEALDNGVCLHCNCAINSFIGNPESKCPIKKW